MAVRHEPWSRTCPTCGTTFASVQHKGDCPSCKLVFDADDTLAAAVLVAKGHCDSMDAAITRLRAARPRLALGKAQLDFVRRICEKLPPDRESATTTGTSAF